MAMGDPDAPVTLTEYASLTCPHCASFHTATLPQIKEDFIDTGKVRLVYREVYFDGPGLWAAMLARCAGEDRYFGVVDVLYRTQQEWLAGSDANAVMANLYKVGRQAGMTDTAMDACMADRDFGLKLVETFQTNAGADNIDSTPSFILDGEKLGNLPFPEFEAKLNAALDS